MVEAINAITEFKRAGFELAESEELAKYALIMTNVAEGITDTGEAANYLVSILKGANLDVSYASKLLDEMNEISNTSAISFDALASMTQRIAGSMYTLGVNVEETQALITGAYEVLQDERVAKGISVIGLRIQGLNEDLEAEAGLQSKVGEAFQKWAGINVFDEQTGQLRDYYDILSELAGVWGTLDKNARTYLLTEAAGKNRADVLASLMNNWSGVEKAMSSAMNSSGSALDEQQAYLESIEGKLALMDNAWQELATTTLSSGMVEFFIELATWVMKLQTAMGGLLPLISTAIGLFLIIKNMKTIAFLKDAIGATVTLGGATKVLTAELQASAIAGARLQVALGWISLALSLAYSAYNLIKNGINEAKKAQEEYRKETVASANEEIGALTKIRKEYEELSKVAEPTNTQQSEMEKILNALGIAFDGASLSADGYKNKLEEVNEATKEGVILNYKKIIETNRSAYEEAQKELGKEISIKFGGGDSVLVNQLDNLDIGIDTTASFWEAFTGQNVKKIKGNYNELVKSFENATKYYEKLMVERALVGKNLTAEESKGYEFVTKQLKELELKYSEQTGIIKIFEGSQDSLNKVIKEGIDTTSKSAEEVDNLGKSLSDLKNNFKTVADGMQTLIDKRKEENDELKRQNELQEKSLAVEKARIALEEARNKKVRVFRAGQGFVDVSDTSGIQSAQEKLIEAQKDKAETEGNIAMEMASDFVSELSAVAESSDVLSAWSSFYDEFGNLMGTEYEDYLIQAKTFVDAYKNVLSGGFDEKDESWRNVGDYVEAYEGYSRSGIQQELKDLKRRNADGRYNEKIKSLNTFLESGAPKYAKGTDSASGGLSMVGEKGAEMRVLNKGDGIIPSNITRNLMAIGSNPSLLGRIVERNNSQVINVGRVEVNGISDVDGFIQELSLIASR